MFPDLRRRLRLLTSQFSLKGTREAAWNNLSEPERRLRALLGEYRKRLSKGSATGPHSKQAMQTRKRFARGKSRQAKRKLVKGTRINFPKQLMVSPKYKESQLLSSITPDRKDRWIPILDRRRSPQKYEYSLSKFSFIDFPMETILSIESLVNIECTAVEAQLHFDDAHCLDVSSYLVLAEIWPAMANVFRGGRMNLPIQKVIDALGLRKDLSMRLFTNDDFQDVWAFPRRMRRATGTSLSATRNLEPQTREKVADEFCDAVDDWLQEATESLQLTDDGKARFARIIGELLDNAERHSDPVGKDGSWSVAAFMAKRKEGEDTIFRCYMGFLSVGATIAEGLTTAPQSIQEQVAKYGEMHSRSGCSKDTLATVVALQDGITRDASAVQNQRGGIGLQDVLEFISVIGTTALPGLEPKMTIVSGRSCIKVRMPYLYGKRSGHSQPRMIWFNESNKPDEPPDPDHVFDLERNFQGTVIGLTFVLDANDLMAKIGDGNQPERPNA